MAAEAEVVSEHHLGRAIVKEAGKSGLRLLKKPTDVTVLKGRGIEVNLGGKSLYVGNRKGLFENEIHIQIEVDTYATEQEIAGNTAVFIADEKKVLGICLLYTSDAADDLLCVDLGGRRIIKKKK